jgi:hypothetical protein
MTRARFRKVAVHLTPLLDLTLIVFFAQYLETRQQQLEAAGTAAAAEQERDRADSEAHLLRSRNRELESELERARAGIGELIEASNAREQRAAQAEGDLELALAQQRVLGELLRELFHVPPEVIETILDPTREPPVAYSPEEIERLREQFRELAAANPGELIRHLLTYEEIRKRCDVWNLFVDKSGVATLNAGDQSIRIRVVPGEFEAEFFERYKSLPQTKGLVIILLTYDRASQRQFVQEVRLSLPRLVDRMREDSSGNARFEYADLGVRVD